MSLRLIMDFFKVSKRLIYSYIQGLLKDARMRRHEGLKILWPVMAVRVQVPLRVLCKALVSSCLRELFLYNY